MRPRCCEEMLLIFAVFAVLAAAVLLFRATKRHDAEIPKPIRPTLEPPPNARPLFAPTGEELRLEIEEKEARAIARREYRSRAAARNKVDVALSAWRENVDSASAARLLRVAAEDGLEGDLEKAANELIKKFHESGIHGLTNNDLAALLDSHIALLSNAERASGAIFWLKQEVAKLRSDSDVENR
jgi:hypothetical protein